MTISKIGSPRRCKAIITVIRGAFHDIFPGLLGFGFGRKLALTKTQQGTDKASEHNRCTVFSQALIFYTHQQKRRQLCFILYSLFVLFPHNLRQLTFLPLPPPPLEHASAIIDRVSVTPSGTPSLPPLTPPRLPIPHLRRFLCRPFLSRRLETGDGAIVRGRPLPFCRGWYNVVSF